MGIIVWSNCDVEDQCESNSDDSDDNDKDDDVMIW